MKATIVRTETLKPGHLVVDYFDTHASARAWADRRAAETMVEEPALAEDLEEGHLWPWAVVLERTVP